MTWRRSANNPILTRESIPDLPGVLVDPSAVFNPGAVAHDGRTLLLLRVQSRGRRTFLFRALGDGERFEVDPTPVDPGPLAVGGRTVHHLYDPRITTIEGQHHVVLAADLDEGCRLVHLRTDDFVRFESVGGLSDRESRNGVLFPERVGGRYLRLERPNHVSVDGSSATGSEIHLASSSDLVRWEPEGPVLSGRARLWDEWIGSGPPPVKTRRGWLHLYHGVATHFAASNVYQVGAVLLDLDDPRKVVARSENNCLEPREPYELTGQVPNVVFPGGWVVERYDDEGFALDASPVRLYYGAADTVVGLARSTVDEILAMCRD